MDSLFISPRPSGSQPRTSTDLFPIEYPDIYDLFNQQVAVFWTMPEIDLTRDLQQFEEKMSANEQRFIKRVLAFFSQFDFLVMKNISSNFSQEVDIPESLMFFAIQNGIEAIHSQTYFTLIETYISKNPEERDRHFHALTEFPSIKQKGEWAEKYMNRVDPFRQRLFAFAIVEGLFFSASFASIYWVKKRNLLPGLTKSNEFIARDEGLHVLHYAALYEHLKEKLDPVIAREMMEDAVRTELLFIQDALPVALIGMNVELMSQYVKYVADRLMNMFGFDKIFHVQNPFDFMKNQALAAKSNFFEERASEYQRTRLAEAGSTSNQFNPDADF